MRKPYAVSVGSSPELRAGHSALGGRAPEWGGRDEGAQNSRDAPRESPRRALAAVSGFAVITRVQLEELPLATSTAGPTRARRTSREPGFYTRAQVEEDLGLTATELDTFE